MIGFVYAIGAGNGAVKLGWSADPLRRLSKISSDCPSNVRLLGLVEASRAQEAEMHRVFAPWCVRREWYRLEGAVRLFVEMLPIPRPRVARKVSAATDAGASPLRIWRAQNNVTLAELSKKTGLQVPSLSCIERGLKGMGLRATERVMAVTGLSLEMVCPKWAPTVRAISEATQ